MGASYLQEATLDPRAGLACEALECASQGTLFGIPDGGSARTVLGMNCNIVNIRIVSER